MPAACELIAQRQHRGVRREHDDLAARRRSSERAVDGAPPLVNDLDPVARDPGILQAVREVTRADPGHDRVLDRGRKRFEVGVPNP